LYCPLLWKRRVRVDLIIIYFIIKSLSLSLFQRERERKAFSKGRRRERVRRSFPKGGTIIIVLSPKEGTIIISYT